MAKITVEFMLFMRELEEVMPLRDYPDDDPDIIKLRRMIGLNDDGSEKTDGKLKFVVIDALLEHNKMNPSELSRIIGRNSQYYKTIKARNTTVPQSLINNMARALGVDPRLITKEEPPETIEEGKRGKAGKVS